MTDDQKQTESQLAWDATKAALTGVLSVDDGTSLKVCCELAVEAGRKTAEIFLAERENADADG